MKHVYALIVKFLMVSAILEIVLRLSTAVAATEILVIAATVTVLSYGGDLVFLRRIRDTMAAVIDGGLAFVIIYLFNNWSAIEKIGFYDAVISAALIGVGEIAFHKFLEFSPLLNKHMNTTTK